MKWLLDLNGGRTGPFSRWLSSQDSHPRVCWYLSSGEDFRDLLYLHPAYQQLHPSHPPGKDPRSPELFLHTDYFPWTDSKFLDTRIIHLDVHTQVELLDIEELPSLSLTFSRELADFPPSHATNRVVFLRVRVHSDKLGSWEAPVLYVFGLNEAFCAEVLLPGRAKISHVVRVRIGNGFGGGKSSGDWLAGVFSRLRTELFISDDTYTGETNFMDFEYRLLPALLPSGLRIQLQSIRVLPGIRWSDYGSTSIRWHLIRHRGINMRRDKQRYSEMDNAPLGESVEGNFPGDGERSGY